MSRILNILGKNTLKRSQSITRMPIQNRLCPSTRASGNNGRSFSTNQNTSVEESILEKNQDLNEEYDEVESLLSNSSESVIDVVPGGFKPRLEEHYYKNMLQDLLVLCYDHSSASSLASLKAHPEWNDSPISTSDPHLLTTTYSSPLHRLPTLPYDDFTTTHLLTNAAGAIGSKAAIRGFYRQKTNPIDYTSVSRKVAKKADLHDPKIAAALADPLTTVSPFVPVVSRIPQLKKISLRIFTKAAINNRMVLMSAFMSLQSITGVAPKTVHADFSDAKQRIRAGMPMGAQVDLIGSDMYSFLDKLNQIVFPRMREFKGLNPEMNAEKVGLYTFTLPETAMGYFPDIEPIFDMYPRLFETQVSFLTTGQSEYETLAVLSGFQLPFMAQKEVKESAKSNEPEDPWAKYKRRQKKK